MSNSAHTKSARSRSKRRVEVAGRQGAAVFLLRAALDDYRSRGEPARAAVLEAMSRFPSDSTWPELSQARMEFA